MRMHIYQNLDTMYLNIGFQKIFLKNNLPLKLGSLENLLTELRMGELLSHLPIFKKLPRP